jgi:hypothetical protein
MTRILPPAYLTFREAVTGRLGPAAISAPGPLLLQLRTLVSATAMSEMGQQATFAPQQFAALFDHLVGASWSSKLSGIVASTAKEAMWSSTSWLAAALGTPG